MVFSASFVFFFAPSAFRKTAERHSAGPSSGEQRVYCFACARIVSASLTSNLPGASTFNVATLPSLTSIE